MKGADGMVNAGEGGRETNKNIERVSLARENEAGGNWGQEVHILQVNI